MNVIESVVAEKGTDDTGYVKKNVAGRSYPTPPPLSYLPPAVDSLPWRPPAATSGVITNG